MTFRIMTDAELAASITIEDALRAIEEALRSRGEGGLVGPPRLRVAVERGSLWFSAGAETKRTHVAGFRFYHTLPKLSPNPDQFTVVVDSQTGAIKGIVRGLTLGGLRTGAIGGVAIKYMSRPNGTCLGILGSGFQARFQLEAAILVRSFTSVKVYSPTAGHREAFAAEMSAKLGIPIAAVAMPEEAVRDADVLICATTQARPVFEVAWLKPGVHINSLGPKAPEAHEIPYETAEQSEVIATDSCDQVDAYDPPFFLRGTPHRSRMVELGDIVCGKQPGRQSEAGITLFCSVGLGGTEVVVAHEALQRVQASEKR